MFERFTERARRVLTLAQEEARLLNHAFIGTEHILLGLVHQNDGVAGQALEESGVSLEAARQKVEEIVGMAATSPVGSPPFTPRAKKVLELSLREALQLNHSYIGTEHLLLGLVREGEGVATQVLLSLGADPGRLRRRVVQLMAGEEDPSGAPPHTEARVGRTAAGARSLTPTVFASRWSSRCVLCGRDLWETAHFVTGDHVRVCEDCIRSAAAVLDAAPPERRQVVMPPRVFGEPPDDGAVAAVVEALRAAFGMGTDRTARAAVVEDYDTVEPIVHRERTSLASGQDDTRASKIRFLTHDVAEVQVMLQRADGTVSHFDGRLRRREGRWLVTAETVASALGHRGLGPPARPTA